MSSNARDLIDTGVKALKAGNKDQARDLLMQAVTVDQYSEDGWLWLSAVVDSPEDQRTCLENVLAINPNNERAQRGLEQLSKPGRMTPTPPSAPAPPPVQFAPPPPPAAPAWTVGDIPTSVQWGASPIETPPPSTWAPGHEMSSTDYDDWVSNLNLPPAPEPKIPDPTQIFTTSPFEIDDEDLFGDDIADLYTDGPFSPGTSEAESELDSASPALPDTSHLMSPGREAAVAESPTSLFEETEEDILFEGDSDLADVAAEELFQYIPPEIKVTRLPGTNETYPAGIIIGLALLLLLNVGAVALLVFQLSQG